METMKLYSIRLYLEPNPGGVYTVTSPDVPVFVDVVSETDVVVPQELPDEVDVPQ